MKQIPKMEKLIIEILGFMFGIELVVAIEAFYRYYETDNSPST
jgi:hypothetical protein